MENDIERLKTLQKSSPYAGEPPRRSLRVEAVMRLSGILGARTPYPDFAGRGLDLPQGEYDYDNRNFWESFNGVVTPAAFRGKRVLDIGCGWGGKTVWYAEHIDLERIAGFDLPGVFEPGVATRFAEAHGVSERCEFTTGVAEDIPFPDGSFDVALMDDVLEHVSDPAKVLRECARVLVPGGTFICRFPSIKMIKAHHFDRATTLPGVHYLANMRVWAAGMNYYLLHNRSGVEYEPFPVVKDTPYGRSVTSDLSGLDLDGFRQLVGESAFDTVFLELTGVPPKRAEVTSPATVKLYESLRAIPPLREILSSSIAFVGTVRGPAPSVPA